MADLLEELPSQLDSRIEAHTESWWTPNQKRVNAQPKRVDSRNRSAAGLDKDVRRELNMRLAAWRAERKAYGEYVDVIWRLLDLKPADFDPGKFKISELIPPKSLGPLNSYWDLRHYVTGRAPGGLVATEDGSLDWERSFRRLWIICLGAAVDFGAQ